MADISLGTLYDANKELMKNVRRLSSKQLDDNLSEIKKIIADEWNTNRYLMLLSNEQHDYTIFRINNSLSHSKLIKELKETLLNRGKILDMTIAPDNSSIEIWINCEDNAVVYYLFPYDLGVIEC